MSKPMYKTVDDARRGRVTGKRVPAKITTRSKKLTSISADEAEEIDSEAKMRLTKILEKIRLGSSGKRPG